MSVCVCVCVHIIWSVSTRENAFGLLFVIWSWSEEMHSVRVNIGCVTQCATQQPDSSCLCRSDILEKVLEQFLHWYFFTSEWVCRWALRLDLSAKALLQWGQEKGFSPVWVLMCPWSNQGLENALPQILQTQGKVWVRMCIFRAPRLTYSLSQYLQLNDFLDWASQCSCLCLASPEKVE